MNTLTRHASLMLASTFMAGAALADDVAAGNAGTRTLDEIVITAQHLNDRRGGIETQTGASTYSIDEAAILATPGGDNTLLNQVILQAPSVVQDSFGQLHVRGDHNDVQYRLNGVILPEGISVFGQSLSPRLISSLKLVTGALPAEYGLRTAGIIDMTTKSGVLDTGGSVSLYGGSHGTVQPSFNYGGRSGSLSYFVSGDLLRNDLGIESPDGRSNPLHDHTTQLHGFGYFEDILDSANRLSLILGTSSGKFQIPNQQGLQPGLGLTVNGQSAYPSESLDENQRELTHYAIVTWQHAQGQLDWQSSLTTRYSSLSFKPDSLGDLLYDGIAQDAFKRDAALGWQTDISYMLTAGHTLRGGWYLQHDNTTSIANSQVLPTDADGNPLSDRPVSIADNGSQQQWIQSVYLQDEWQAATALTVNYGLRFDHYTGYSSGSQLSPRLNAVWRSGPDTTLHAGYSRYFTPPPFELVGTESVAKFTGTTAATEVTTSSSPLAERSDYYDLGLEQKVGDHLTVAVDGYYRKSAHLIDEGQFGAPIILTPFNYAQGVIKGAEFSVNYDREGFSTYANLAFSSARGQQIESSQFNFGQDELDYIAAHSIHLDHEQRVTASAGASWLVAGSRLSADLLFGTGLRADLTLPDGSDVPNGDHLPTYTQVNVGASHAFQREGPGALTLRFDVINLFDKVYEIRDGSGVGVGAPQFGPRRGLFVGASMTL